MADAVYLGALTRETRRAIDGWLISKDRLELADRAWVQFESVCAMWFELKHEPDTEELFPKGKWATLQKLESLIEEAMKCDTESSHIAFAVETNCGLATASRKVINSRWMYEAKDRT